MKVTAVRRADFHRRVVHRNLAVSRVGTPSRADTLMRSRITSEHDPGLQRIRAERIGEELLFAGTSSFGRARGFHIPEDRHYCGSRTRLADRAIRNIPSMDITFAS